MFKKNEIENYDKIRINYDTYLDKNKSNKHETNIFLNDLNLYNKDLSEIKTQEAIEKILNEIFNIKNEDDYYENIEVCLLKAIAKQLLNNDKLNKLSDILNFF